MSSEATESNYEPTTLKSYTCRNGKTITCSNPRDMYLLDLVLEDPEYFPDNLWKDAFYPHLKHFECECGSYSPCGTHSITCQFYRKLPNLDLIGYRQIGKEICDERFGTSPNRNPTYLEISTDPFLHHLFREQLDNFVEDDNFVEEVD